MMTSIQFFTFSYSYEIPTYKHMPWWGFTQEPLDEIKKKT